MDGAGAYMYDPRDDIGERAGGFDRRLVTGTHDGTGDRAGVTFFAERLDDRGKVPIAGAGDDICRARTVAAHAHVERAVEAEREATGGFVELHRRHADVEHDAVDSVMAAGTRHDFEIGEAVLNQDQTPFRARNNVEAAGNRPLVAVDADDVAVGSVED